MFLAAFLITLVACEKAPEPPTHEPRRDASPDALSTPAPPAGAAADAPPPMPSGELPAGHPPIGQVSVSPGDLAFSAPDAWMAKATRAMTKAIYELPKVEGDAENADLAVSHFPGMRDIPFDANVSRWCGQFEQPDGSSSREAVKRWELEGSKHPATVIEISGRYKASSMAGPAGAPKEDYRMLAAEIRTDGGPWYVKMVGPAKTVEHWKEAFEEFIRTAQ
jgi:hypothetical protein